MVATLADDLVWQVDGLCREVDPELFFTDDPGALDEAKLICRRCAVRDECLADGLSDPGRSGVWGGTTEQERRVMLGRPAKPRFEPRRSAEPGRAPGRQVRCGCGRSSCPGMVHPRTEQRHRAVTGGPAPAFGRLRTASPVDCRCGLPGCAGKVSRQTRMVHGRKAAGLTGAVAA